MQYVKLVTDDQETRWINLASIARVTRTRSATTGKLILVVMFRPGGGTQDFKIEGDSPENTAAIDTLCNALDALSS